MPNFMALLVADGSGALTNSPRLYSWHFLASIIHIREAMMDTRALYEKGLKLRREMLGAEAVEARMNALGAFGEPLQNIITEDSYGDVWSRTALPPATKSLAMIAMMAAASRANELTVHVKGAILHGCTAEPIQGISLLGALSSA